MILDLNEKISILMHGDYVTPATPTIQYYIGTQDHSMKYFTPPPPPPPPEAVRKSFDHLYKNHFELCLVVFHCWLCDLSHHPFEDASSMKHWKSSYYIAS